MDSMFTLGVILSAKDTLSPVMGKAGESVGKLASKIEAVSGKMAVMGTASYGMGRAMLSPVMDTLGAYKELEKAQGEIASLGIGTKGIEAITKSAKEFSNQFAGTTAKDFVAASYDIKSGISSLSDTAIGEFTKIAAMTGVATKSSTDQMTSLFATGYGIYRKQFSEFGTSTITGWQNLSDEEKDIKFGEYFSAGIASSVQAFKTDGSRMSAALSSLGATATSAGVSFAEQLSILGRLQSTMSGSEAATKYRAFLTSVAEAGDKLKLSFTDANNKLLSTPEIINAIKEKYGETIDAVEKQELKKAFGTDEAVAMIELMYNETDALTGNINTMNVSLGEGTKKTREMAEAINKGKEFDLLGQQVGNLSSTIGQIFAPVATKMASVIGSVVTSIQTFTEENETATTVIGYTVAGIGALLTVVGAVIIPISAIGMALPALVTGFGLVSGAVGVLGTVMSTVGRIFLMNPIGLAVTAIAGLAYLIYSNWEPISNFFSSLWDRVTSIFASTITVIKDYLGWTPIGILLNNWGVITTYFSGLWDGVVTIFSNTWSSIKSSFNGVVEFIQAPFEVFFGWIAAKFEWISDFIGSTLKTISNIGDKVGGAVSNVGSSIGDGLKTASNWFKFGDSQESSIAAASPTKQDAANNKNFSIGQSVKNVAVGTALATQMAVAQPAALPMAIAPTTSTQMAVAQPTTKAIETSSQMAVAQPVNNAITSNNKSMEMTPPGNSYNITIQVQNGNPEQIAQEVKKVIAQMEQSRKNRSYSEMEA